MNLKTVMLIMFLPLLAINCLRNLKVLAPFSTLGKKIVLKLLLWLSSCVIFSQCCDFRRIGIRSLLCVPRSSVNYWKTCHCTHRKISSLLWNSFVRSWGRRCRYSTRKQHGTAKIIRWDMRSLEYRNDYSYSTLWLRRILRLHQIRGWVKGQHHIELTSRMVSA